MHGSHENDEAPPDVTKGHETRDISTRVVVIFAVCLVVGAVDRPGRDLAALRVVREGRRPGVPARIPDGARRRARSCRRQPRLQTQPREDLKRMRAEEDRILGSYGWVDANARHRRTSRSSRR